MLYLTYPNETPWSIAEKFAREGIYLSPKAIQKENVGREAECLMAGPYYAPNLPIFLPMPDQPTRYERDCMVDAIGWFPSWARLNLRSLQDTPMTAEHFTRMADRVALLNAHSQRAGMLDSLPEKLNIFDEYFLTPIEDIIEARSRRLEKVVKSVESVIAESVEHGKLARNGTATVDEISHSFRNLQGSVSKMTQDFGEDLAQLRKSNIHLDLRDVKSVEALSQHVHLLQRLAFVGSAVTIATDALTLTEEYRKGGHWVKDGVKDGINIAVNMGSVALADGAITTIGSALMLTPVGWVGAIAVGLTAAILSGVITKKIDSLFSST